MKHEGGHEDYYLGGVVPWQLHDKSPTMSKKRLIAIASASGGCKKIAIVVVAPVE